MTPEGDAAPLAYAFDADHGHHAGELVELLGGKGAGLALMTAMGLPVPPGFTMTTAACRSYLDNGWSDEHERAVLAGLAELETCTGKRLGDPESPLVLSVRSGAPVSMPGILDTVLDVGMTPEVAEGLAEQTGDGRFARDTLRRSMLSHAAIVAGADAECLRAGSEITDIDTLRRHLADHGAPFPSSPVAQVHAAVRAVLDSWSSDRAIRYRSVEHIGPAAGTAATVQAMVFGNLGEDSGAGVAFSRHPTTGRAGLMGEFLPDAQGQDVVAGDHETRPLEDMRPLWPDVWASLDSTATRLEREFGDMVDIEFTVERGRLWLLQARRAKRSPLAALRVAIDMAEDPAFDVDRTEAVRRCRSYLRDPPTIDATAERTTGAVIVEGQAAAPGRAVGVLCLDLDRAVELDAEGQDVVLVRRETSPADIRGMAAAKGFVTTLGGPVSHAAIVARSWGLPAVVGAAELSILDGAVRGPGGRVEEGEIVTVDGDAGQLLHGAHPGHRTIAPEVAVMQQWADDADRGRG